MVHAQLNQTSYYGTLALYFISLPGLYSTNTRAVKFKPIEKVYEAPGPAAGREVRQTGLFPWPLPENFLPPPLPLAPVLCTRLPPHQHPTRPLHPGTRLFVMCPCVRFVCACVSMCWCVVCVCACVCMCAMHVYMHACACYMYASDYVRVWAPAGEISAYFRAMNFQPEPTGDKITFRGTMGRSRGQAAFLTFVTFLRCFLLCLSVCLSVCLSLSLSLSLSLFLSVSLSLSENGGCLPPLVSA